MIGLITARKGSKGLPAKNRILMPHLLKHLDRMRGEYHDVWISTDDEFLMDLCATHGVKVHQRDSFLANDTASTTSVVLDFIYSGKCDSRYISLLFPTYPLRDHHLMRNAMDKYMLTRPPSMVGFKKAKTHPYRCYTETDGKLTKVIDHDFFRRQDYPDVMEICHAICIMDADEVHRLDGVLMCEDSTAFMIDDKYTVDIDTHEDLERFRTNP